MLFYADFFLFLFCVFTQWSVRASDGADGTDCFRSTNSSYEYVKWLNGGNEVQTEREKGRHT